jgi:hypothetical protein
MMEAFNETILHKYSVQYYFCKPCLFVQTEKPYWLEEAYDDAIASSDTGLVQRNFIMASKLAVYIFLNLKSRASFLDIAGGYGMLTRLMRDFGFNYFWSDPYCKNLHAVGFEGGQTKKEYLAISAFEVLEHVENPLEFISDHLNKNSCKTIVFSTELFEGDHPPDLGWWYYSFSTGQHISFFSGETLKVISQKLNLTLYSFNGLHILTDQPLKFPVLTRVLTKSHLAPVCAFVIRFILGSKTISDSKENILRSKPSH